MNQWRRRKIDKKTTSKQHRNHRHMVSLIYPDSNPKVNKQSNGEKKLTHELSMHQIGALGIHN